MITALLTSKLAQMIGAAVALLLAWLANGALQRRKGRVAERKQAAARDAKAAIETTERINRADLHIGATDDERIKALKRFSDKHGG